MSKECISVNFNKKLTVSGGDDVSGAKKMVSKLTNYWGEGWSYRLLEDRFIMCFKFSRENGDVHKDEWDLIYGREHSIESISFLSPDRREIDYRYGGYR